MSDDIIKRLRETSGAIFSTSPWHAPGLGEVFDAGNRCIAICIDCDPVEEHERPVPAHDEGELIANHIAAASPDNIAALLDRLDKAERALKAARDWIAADRQSFVECAKNPLAADGQDMSEMDRAALVDYDGILAEIDAARAAERGKE